MRTLSLVVLSFSALACGPAGAPAADVPTAPSAEPNATATATESSGPSPHGDASSDAGLSIVAEADRRFTGVAVDRAGAIYVNFPRWSDAVPISVARLDEAGVFQPYPDARWNDWSAGDPAGDAWVCVQSVHVDHRGRLWVLDPGNPKFAGVVPGAPKLVLFEPPTAKPREVIRFDATVARSESYLNDVRVDVERNFAFITDSGDGALVVVDLAAGTARRVLDDHRSTRAEDVVLTIGGRPFDRKVHADGIAYDPEGDYVYFQALTGRTLYRIAGAALRDASLTDEQLGQRVEQVAQSGASDGLLFHDGRIWISALEHDAIRTVRMGEQPETVVTDPRIAWPDSFAAAGEAIYFTTAQIHLDDDPKDPFRVWRLSLQ